MTDEPEQPDEDIEEVDDLDSEPEELSLNQLSEAYAQVLKEQSGDEALEDEPLEEAVEKPKPKKRVKKQKSLSEIDAEDNAGCQISPESIVESILFVGAPKDVKLTSRKIAALIRDVSPKEVTAIVKALNKRYKSEGAPYTIDSEKGTFKMRLDDSMHHILERFRGGTREAKLTQQAIDVLAVVAYNQPLTRDQVENIRAKSSGSVLAQLVRRHLLAVEVSETTPVQRFYRTTDRFLDLFGLDEIQDLPQSHDVANIEELAD